MTVFVSMFLYYGNITFGWTDNISVDTQVFERYALSFYMQTFPVIDRGEVVRSYTVFENNPVESLHIKTSAYTDFDFEKYNALLEIPRVKIKGPIVKGQNEEAMNRGFWHYPGTGDIKYGGNIVIIGHRFLHIPPAQDTFYNLDKVQIGDSAFIQSSLGTWEFLVIEKKVVSKHDISVLQNTDDMQLTLITCHPLWTDEERLVIIAKLIDEAGGIR